MLVSPLVIEFVDNQYAQLVAQLYKTATIRIMAGTDMVHTKLLHQLDALLDGTWIGGGSQCT